MYLVYKQLGETPLECLERVREESDISTDIPMTYAGRLDPMAEGLMIILAGEECKEKEAYTGLDKTYEFEILVGFETDTYDLLGLVTKNTTDLSETLDKEYFQTVLDTFVGSQEQHYPLYSSKTVDGKQLHAHAREGNTTVEIPNHSITIYNVRCTSTANIEREGLKKQIQKKVKKVHGDFRQEEVVKKWQEVLADTPEKEFQIFSCIVECSSGTYVRQLVHDIGAKLGMPCVTFSIKRTRIGEYR